MCFTTCVISRARARPRPRTQQSRPRARCRRKSDLGAELVAVRLRAGRAAPLVELVGLGEARQSEVAEARAAEDADAEHGPERRGDRARTALRRHRDRAERRGRLRHPDPERASLLALADDEDLLVGDEALAFEPQRMLARIDRHRTAGERLRDGLAVDPNEDPLELLLHLVLRLDHDRGQTPLDAGEPPGARGRNHRGTVRARAHCSKSSRAFTRCPSSRSRCPSTAASSHVEEWSSARRSRAPKTTTANAARSETRRLFNAPSVRCPPGPSKPYGPWPSQDGRTSVRG